MYVKIWVYLLCHIHRPDAGACANVQNPLGVFPNRCQMKFVIAQQEIGVVHDIKTSFILSETIRRETGRAADRSCSA